MKEIDIKLIIFSMAGGLALFLFGMKILSDGLQMAFGNKIKNLLEKLTDNKLAGVGVGALVTAIIQSSSITTVTVVGLINAGLITLAQSIPVIMGSNIGTTITAQLIAFKVGKFALPIIAIGFVMSVLGDKIAGFIREKFCKADEKTDSDENSKSEKGKGEKSGNGDIYNYIGQIVLGFGILFLGMNLMSSEAKHLVNSPTAVKLLADMGKSPFLGILSGAIFTGIVQSSSATTGLIISMAMESGGKTLINLPSAIALVLGANIGTCVTVLIASIGSSLSSKRAALAHILFNIIGVIIFIPFIGIFAHLIQHTSPQLPRQIANAHVVFNIVTTALLLPLSGYLLTLVTRIVPGEEIRLEKGVKFLDENTLKTPAIALDMSEKETSRMINITLTMIESSRMALFEKKADHIELVKEKEGVVDFLDDRIEVFLERIPKEKLSRQQKTKLAVLTHVISDIERIADHTNNICELAEIRIRKNIRFSEEAFAQLNEIFELVDESIERVMKLIGENDMNQVDRIMQIEEEVDKITIDLENEHMERLETGICRPGAGPLFLDILRNLERITDHAHNIAAASKFGF